MPLAVISVSLVLAPIAVILNHERNRDRDEYETMPLLWCEFSEEV